MEYNILVINPGSTSTKVAWFEGEKQLRSASIDHSARELDRFSDILDQEDYRAELIKDLIREWQVKPETLSAVVGRGGLLPNMKAGGYLVNEAMVRAIRSGKASPHASNLGALLAKNLADPLGIPAFIYDCVTSDEFTEIAKITGMPNVRRESMCHVLNMKAVCRKAAEKHGGSYETMNFIVAHLGGGISISIHHKGKIIDAIRDDAGPFSPERAGSIPLLYMIDLCYSGVYNRKEMIKNVRGMGGMKAYLGTQDCREIEAMIASGDEKAKLLYEAQAYQIAKGIGELAPVLDGNVDYIILTGGMAYSQMMTGMVAKRVGFIAPVEIIAGEREMEALALGAARVLDGEKVREYEEV
ncbi:butyrate kinase [bacterium 210820-DFI.6.37]|nr:butyrate kinase [bacterium 210820-DFI.6.37]